jgi:hypothetical protein
MTPIPTSKLLVNEPPLLVLPTLAARLGLKEAIVLQQIHYWIREADHHRGGRWWTWNTLEKWRAHFPWWSLGTVKGYSGDSAIRVSF